MHAYTLGSIVQSTGKKDPLPAQYVTFSYAHVQSKLLPCIMLRVYR